MSRPSFEESLVLLASVLERSWWRVITVTGLAVSFLLMALFFRTWFIPIQVINAALILALLWLDWPSEAMVGA
jgi:hypothetical protein